MGSTGDKKQKGYEVSYQREQNSVAMAMKQSCDRMSAEWSDPPGKAKAPCPHCAKSVSVKAYHVPRTIITPMGEVIFTRHYYYCPDCSKGFYPKDQELELDEEDMTDDVVGFIVELIVSGEFRLSAERLEFHHGIKLSATKLKQLFERKTAALADAEKPQPVVPLPLNDSNAHFPVVIEADGSMVRQMHGFGEVKLWDINVLGETEHVYLTESNSKDRFEAQLFESTGFDKLSSRTVLWIADGAKWIWYMQDRLCPDAYQLLDFYHAMEHAHDAAKALLGEGDICAELFAKRISDLLMRGETDLLFDELKECIPYKPRYKVAKQIADILLSLLKYYQHHSDRLNYKYFKDRGWPIGSGSVESAHKRVIQKRMKQAGMRWSKENVQRMASLRAIYCSVGPKRLFPSLQQSWKNAA